ncbi:nucleoid-associated protein [Acinetobacter bereziniae]|uniref:nucleoid-associated protein n=1 Tax=Acinetobacter bereziniae TaxID=106648 RepID=UPI0012506AAB|nr:nucleoid-associated protein [Acinetobacter bereziniae]
MSCEITAFIVHKMIPAENPRLIAEFGTGVLDHNDSIQNLMDTLNKRYMSQGGRTFGQFSTDQTNYPISRLLDDSDILNNPENFYTLSNEILSHLVSKASSTSATSGWVLMCLYEQNAEQVLAVAVVTETTGASINDAFQVQPAIYIDLSKLRHAGRINLTKWKANQKGYVNFIKAARESTYFKEFLGCESTNSNVEESNKVIIAIRAYCDSKGFDYIQRKNTTDLAYQWLQTASKARRPILLAHLAMHLDQENAEELTAFLTADEYAINDEFIPDGRSLKQLVELHTQDNHWDIKLSNDAFEHGAIYNVETKSLILPVTNIEDQEMFARHVQGLEDHDTD